MWLLTTPHHTTPHHTPPHPTPPHHTTPHHTTPHHTTPHQTTAVPTYCPSASAGLLTLSCSPGLAAPQLSCGDSPRAAGRAGNSAGGPGPLQDGCEAVSGTGGCEAQAACSPLPPARPPTDLRHRGGEAAPAMHLVTHPGGMTNAPGLWYGQS